VVLGVAPDLEAAINDKICPDIYVNYAFASVGEPSTHYGMCFHCHCHVGFRIAEAVNSLDTLAQFIQPAECEPGPEIFANTAALDINRDGGAIDLEIVIPAVPCQLPNLGGESLSDWLKYIDRDGCGRGFGGNASGFKAKRLGTGSVFGCAV
jgi:hypothetical protein